MKMKIFGMLLIAGSLMFASCEKEEIDEKEEDKIEQPNDTTTTDPITNDKDSLNQEEIDNKVVCFSGKLTKVDGRFAIQSNGKLNFFVGKEDLLAKYLYNCADVCGIKSRSNKEDAPYEVTDASACKEDKPVVDQPKRCFNGILSRNQKGQYGIWENNTFFRFNGQENNLKAHFDQCVDICAVKFQDNEGEAYDPITIVSCKTNEDKPVVDQPKTCFNGILRRNQKGQYGIWENNTFFRFNGQENNLKAHLNQCVDICAVKFQDNDGEAYDPLTIVSCNTNEDKPIVSYY